MHSSSYHEREQVQNARIGDHLLFSAASGQILAPPSPTTVLYNTGPDLSSESRNHKNARERESSGLNNIFYYQKKKDRVVKINNNRD